MGQMFPLNEFVLSISEQMMLELFDSLLRVDP